MREIHLTPIPSAKHAYVGDHEEIELICHECDLNVHAEGSDLILVTEALDDAHAVRHPVGAS